ncbi:PREDICTED: dormancy-associated protein homolog 4-like [Camelina sativa]|uniref:Dormancy-associated protein homolog 4-like n=1 Tax=Camelina sativa TaxID=90675 RepID=A0ABM1R0S7_CAMSA|nr:PREDICTED: dormancy-associated protein homolog 4-like [Camelina sativa]
MEFLHKLWDETLAGPTPEYGSVGKLRNHISGENGHRKLLVSLGCVPDNGSSNLASPLTPGTPNETHATSLNACDWIVLNELDR